MYCYGCALIIQRVCRKLALKRFEIRSAKLDRIASVSVRYCLKFGVAELNCLFRSDVRQVSIVDKDTIFIYGSAALINKEEFVCDARVLPRKRRLLECKTAVRAEVVRVCKVCPTVRVVQSAFAASFPCAG